MTEPTDFNQRIIEEFRSNEGRVGGPFEGAPLLLLSSTGAKTGRKHTTPVMYLQDGDRLVIFASKAGAPSHPAWYHNLVANPQASVEVGTESFPVTATEVKGEERNRLYDRQASLYPGFRDYQDKTSRVIPVIALTRTG
ncbi:MAG TPA: nitroreductase family deazaflavin-dependent oxidoreductase [Chloroflexota bacterium]|nr:nitroreductase family deazaflavin-dependent oxidoreductase [Chloroflexota bacterium]